MDNRFLRCVAEHRGFKETDWGNRFSKLVAEERGCIPKTIPTIPTSPIRVYYTAEASKPTKPTESFVDRYKRTMEQRKPKPEVTSNPLPQRSRQLSILSQESFPSLPSTGSSTNSPQLKGWSDALKKDFIPGGILHKPKLRVKSATVVADAEPEEVIVYDDDGFPHLVSI